jgi:hypothetical protein
MNTIIARSLELLAGLGYFALAITVCVGLMKFLGHKILSKTATIFLIGFPTIGILGGTIEWLFTGVAEASKSVTFNMADKCFGIAFALYALAFFSYLMFGEEKQNSWVNKTAKAK